MKYSLCLCQERWLKVNVKQWSYFWYIKACTRSSHINKPQRAWDAHVHVQWTKEGSHNSHVVTVVSTANTDSISKCMQLCCSEELRLRWVPSSALEKKPGSMPMYFRTDTCDCLDCVPEAQGLVCHYFYLVGYLRTQLYCSLSQAVLELPETWRSGYNESSWKHIMPVSYFCWQLVADS